MQCIFCDIVNKKSEAKIIYSDDLILAILDKYPIKVIDFDKVKEDIELEVKKIKVVI